MALTSFEFLAFCLVTLTLYRLAWSAAQRLFVILIGNIVFIASLLPIWTDGWSMIAFAMLGYCGTVTIARWPGSRFLATNIVLVLGMFVVLRYVGRWGPLTYLPAFSIVGFSYVLFRIIHVMIDVGQGEMERCPGLLEYLAYLFYFPAILSGPVNRFEDFIEGVKHPPESSQREKEALLTRILFGLTKVMIVAPVIEQFFRYFYKGVLNGSSATVVVWPLDPASAGATSPSIGLSSCTAVAAALYSAYLYYNFSGYTDLVVSISAVFGIKLPENFNRPFAAENVSDFWSRWHMSLSQWFRTYVFTPLVLAVSAAVPDRRFATASACICLFGSFLLIGLWHGSTLVFLFYGLYLGGMAAGHRLYQAAVLAAIGRKGARALTQNLVYSYICRGLTAAYFALALVCFWLDAAQIGTLVCRLGAVGVMATIADLTLTAIVTMSLWDFAVAGWQRAINNVAPANLGLRQVKMAALCFVVLTVGVLFNSAPGFVYQGF